MLSDYGSGLVAGVPLQKKGKTPNPAVSLLRLLALSVFNLLFGSPNESATGEAIREPIGE